MNQLFRKQFLFAPESLVGAKFPDWKKHQINAYSLRTHPALMSNISESSSRKVIFLGTSVHCLHPDWDEKDIATALAECKGEQDWLDELDALCGNFIVIEIASDNVRFFHDVSSSGKIFYIKDDGKVVLGSDPLILSEIVELEQDLRPQAVRFYESGFFKNAKNKKWLGDLTCYKNLFQVLPNHAFDLNEQNVFRYYPRKPREEQEVSTIISRAASMLQNIAEGVFKRDNAFVSVTAGWDSRVIMASTRKFSVYATYYTFSKPGNAVNESDVEIASRMCNDLSLRHRLVKPLQAFPKDFSELYKSSFALGEDSRSLSFLGLFDQKIVETYTITGSISEIAKNYFECLSIRNGKMLAKAAHYPADEYAINYFQRWLDDSKEPIEKYGYTLQDFAHWEQDIANFAGQGIAATSLIAKRISPFNCRLLIDLILQANIRYRDGHNNVVYRGIIEKLWPELLKYPVNPTSKVKLITAAKRTGLYSLYRRLRHRFVD